ncbi:MAG TPA: hypothetical protein VJ596_00880 [Gemmatimonadaceae bacterium]|nr:hypothetical protein [Gemmatimonadaceae bacterium]
MSDLRDLSRLPVDEKYWDDLEARIMSDLGPRVREGANARAGWLRPLGARAWTLGAIALAASVAALLLMPPRQPDDAQRSSGVLGIPAKDPVVAAFVAAPEPPELGALMLSGGAR